MNFKSSRWVRKLLNWIIRHVNHRLPPSEWIPHIPWIPFVMENQKEEVVIRYFNLLMDEYADWHDNSNVRAEEVQQEMEAIVREHGAMLREYLEPYRGMNHKATVGEEFRRCRIATDLFTAEA